MQVIHQIQASLPTKIDSFSCLALRVTFSLISGHSPLFTTQVCNPWVLDHSSPPLLFPIYGSILSSMIFLPLLFSPPLPPCPQTWVFCLPCLKHAVHQSSFAPYNQLVSFTQTLTFGSFSLLGL